MRRHGAAHDLQAVMKIESTGHGEEEGGGEAEGKAGLHRGSPAGREKIVVIRDQQAGKREQSNIERQEEQAENGRFDMKPGLWVQDRVSRG
jgi:hypothetical protein